jgi:hypothetical protein
LSKIIFIVTVTLTFDMNPLWKGKNPIYVGVITIMPFDNLYRRAYFVMHTFLVIITIILIIIIPEIIFIVTVTLSFDLMTPK